MITLFNVEYLINSGVAGGMSAYTQQGDIVISTDAVQHDFDTTVFGDPLGEVADLGVTFYASLQNTKGNEGRELCLDA